MKKIYVLLIIANILFNISAYSSENITVNKKHLSSAAKSHLVNILLDLTKIEMSVESQLRNSFSTDKSCLSLELNNNLLSSVSNRFTNFVFLMMLNKTDLNRQNLGKLIRDIYKIRKFGDSTASYCKGLVKNSDESYTDRNQKAVYNLSNKYLNEVQKIEDELRSIQVTFFYNEL